MANQAVYGIVSKRAQAEQIIDALVKAGVSHSDISLLAAENKEFSEYQRSATVEHNHLWQTQGQMTNYGAGNEPEKKSQASMTSTPEAVGGLGHEKHTKAPEGATTGATTGGIIGGALGFLAGIGALAIPGLGPFIAAGPLMAALSGLGAGSAVGGVIGALIGSGIPEYEAKRYENRLKEGGILLGIRANSDALAQQIKDIMGRHGASDVSISSEASMPKDYN